MRDAIAALRKALESGDAEAIGTAQKTLSNAQHQVAQVLYQSTAQQPPADAPGAGEPGPGSAPGAGPADQGEVIDAEYEDVK